MIQNRCSWPRRTALVAVWICASSSAAPAADDGEAAFRELYRELIEINTTLSEGSCTAAEAMAARLRGAGFPADAIECSFPPISERTATWSRDSRAANGGWTRFFCSRTSTSSRAKRADWEREPFKLVEENGFFYARGASDDKAMAAIFTDSLIRFRKEATGRAGQLRSRLPVARRPRAFTTE